MEVSRQNRHLWMVVSRLRQCQPSIFVSTFQQLTLWQLSCFRFLVLPASGTGQIGTAHAMEVSRWNAMKRVRGCSCPRGKTGRAADCLTDREHFRGENQPWR